MKRLVVVLIAAAISGCASGPEWRHGHLSGGEAERDFLIADGRCAKEAAAIAIPQTPTQQSGYQVSGTSQTTYGTSTSNTRFTAEARQDSGPLAISQHVQASGDRGAALGTRQRIYTGCMAEHGWAKE